MGQLVAGCGGLRSQSRAYDVEACVCGGSVSGRIYPCHRRRSACAGTFVSIVQDAHANVIPHSLLVSVV